MRIAFLLLTVQTLFFSYSWSQGVKSVKDTVKSQISFDWIHPDRYPAEGYKSIWCEIKILSNIRLDTSSFYFAKDDIRLSLGQGRKSGEESLSEKQLSTHSYEYVASKSIKLNPKMNYHAITFHAKDKNGKRHESKKWLVKVIKEPKVSNISWVSPSMGLDKTLSYSETALQFKLTFSANILIREEDIEIYLDNHKQKISGGSIRLTRLRDKYSIEVLVSLKRAKANQKLHLEIKGFPSEKVVLKYTEKGKPNMYVVSIGTQSDLKYTVNDAKDFANTLAKQKVPNPIFEELHVETLLGEAADATAISDLLGDYSEYKRINGQDIKFNDLLVVFLSSHGFMYEGELWIHGTGFKPRQVERTAVKYEEILGYLDNIPCNKAIFIDACQNESSYGIKATFDPGAINNALDQLNRNTWGTTTVLSCQQGQYSYEDNAWENGAFTEAILLGLNRGGSDLDGDNIITISELFTFVKPKVSNLVRGAKKNIPNVNQEPHLIESGGSGKVPLFILNK